MNRLWMRTRDRWSRFGVEELQTILVGLHASRNVMGSPLVDRPADEVSVALTAALEANR